MQPLCKCQNSVFFSLSSYVSDDVSKKNSASWLIYFCQEPLYNEGFSFSLGQQASPLRKRKKPSSKGAPTKVFLLQQCKFVSYILRHVARHRKKNTGRWHLQGGCNYHQKMTAQVIPSRLYCACSSTHAVHTFFIDFPCPRCGNRSPTAGERGAHRRIGSFGVGGLEELTEG